MISTVKSLKGFNLTGFCMGELIFNPAGYIPEYDLILKLPGPEMQRSIFSA
jgi:hypothetical protein